MQDIWHFLESRARDDDDNMDAASWFVVFQNEQPEIFQKMEDQLALEGNLPFLVKINDCEFPPALFRADSVRLVKKVYDTHGPGNRLQTSFRSVLRTAAEARAWKIVLWLSENMAALYGAPRDAVFGQLRDVNSIPWGVADSLIDVTSVSTEAVAEVVFYLLHAGAIDKALEVKCECLPPLFLFISCFEGVGRSLEPSFPPGFLRVLGALYPASF